MSNPILSLLGLALRAGRLEAGEEPAALAAKAHQARLILLASDAADNTRRRAEHLAEESHCLRLVLPFSKAELGGALGRGSAAIAALTDTGFAAAVTEKLAIQDPERYGEIAGRMRLKQQRAKERKAAPRRAPPENRRPPNPPREASGSRNPKDRRSPESRRAPARIPGSRQKPQGQWKSDDRRKPQSRRKSEGRPDRAAGGGQNRRPYSGKSGTDQRRRPSGKGRPFQNKGGPRSGGGHGPDRGR